MVSLTYAIVEFIVDNRAPVAWLLILHWLHIWETGQTRTEEFAMTFTKTPLRLEDTV